MPEARCSKASRARLPGCRTHPGVLVVALHKAPLLDLLPRRPGRAGDLVPLGPLPLYTVQVLQAQQMRQTWPALGAPWLKPVDQHKAWLVMWACRAKVLLTGALPGEAGLSSLLP